MCVQGGEGGGERERWMEEVTKMHVHVLYHYCECPVFDQARSLVMNFDLHLPR